MPNLATTQQRKIQEPFAQAQQPTWKWKTWQQLPMSGGAYGQRVSVFQLVWPVHNLTKSSIPGVWPLQGSVRAMKKYYFDGGASSCWFPPEEMILELACSAEPISGEQEELGEQEGRGE